MAERCPTTGLPCIPTAEIARYTADRMRNPYGTDYETYPCHDADHWHVRLPRTSPTPRRGLPDPAAFAVAMTVLVLLTLLIAVLDFTASDLGGIIVGFASALIATAVFRLLRKD